MNHNESLFKRKYKETQEEGFARNKELVERYKQAFLDAQKYNKGKLLTPTEDDFLIEEIISRDISSTII